MRNTIIALLVAVTFIAGGLDAETPKSTPADVGAGHVAWFDARRSSQVGMRWFP
jgi:hypothetical protein